MNIYGDGCKTSPLLVVASPTRAEGKFFAIIAMGFKPIAMEKPRLCLKAIHRLKAIAISSGRFISTLKLSKKLCIFAP